MNFVLAIFPVYESPGMIFQKVSPGGKFHGYQRERTRVYFYAMFYQKAQKVFGCCTSMYINVMYRVRGIKYVVICNQGIVASENYRCKIIHVIYHWKDFGTRKPKSSHFLRRVK